ncbi:siderophore-interacting protein [Kocuria massiliensis]|uniref:siderophore-interacting protein n=1 Tax=Kocuria massiliensis TaxID=1926282 RepID=UPI000A1CD697|nr:siderophore-interacting protein [Kocuria massiliensis]
MTDAQTNEPRVAPARKPAKPQTLLEVIERRQLTPHMVRLTLGGKGFESFQDNGMTDQYVKLVFAKPELNLVAPFDMRELKRTLPPEDVPVTRTYTVRSVNREAKTLTIDFVTHGTSGLAAPWAAQASPGDTLLLMGPGGKYRPNDDAEWHLFAGDASALPAISASIEALPEDARGLAVITLEHEEDQQEIRTPHGVEIDWVIQPGVGGDPNALAAALGRHAWPDGTISVFAHGEREAIKQVRRLLKERNIPKENISISGYWAFGRTEDKFQAEKREPIGAIED